MSRRMRDGLGRRAARMFLKPEPQQRAAESHPRQPFPELLAIQIASGEIIDGQRQGRVIA